MLVMISSGSGVDEVMRALWHFERWLGERYDYEVVERESGECPMCTRSLLIRSMDERLRALEGTHLWRARSPFRTRHKRRNWYFSLRCYDEPTESDTDPREIEYQSMRSPKNGGQHANTTSSGVRAVHRGLGLSAVSYDERSQHRNRKIAHERLIAKIALHGQSIATDARETRWREGKEIERGDALLVFRGESFALLRHP